MSDLLKGFSKLSREERFERLLELGILTYDDICYLNSGGLQDITLGEKLIENVIGYFQLPMGVATNMCIDGVDHIIPMAVEETSIIASLSKTARFVKEHGSITTSLEGESNIGQVHFPDVQDFASFSTTFEVNKQKLMIFLNQGVANSMMMRGGGVTDMQLRQIMGVDGSSIAVVHVLFNSCNSMGANIITQVVESLKEPLEQLTGETAGICILSNLNDNKITQATVELHDVDPDLAKKIMRASIFAESDPYRAATHNKGVMNGIDPVLLVTGNDWRAVEAGIHAYAAQDGRYKAITTWRYADKVLIGKFRAPLVVGTVGGVTSLHPTAQLCLRMLQVSSASHLSRVIAAVGLVQNLGSLIALCSGGVMQGHMKLHIDNLILAAGALHSEYPILKQKLQEKLTRDKHLSLHDAHLLLAKIRDDLA
jgi:hydroxymethylglutaryl-CoA reductase